MRLITIWTMPTLSIKERITRTYGLFIAWVARRLPERVRYEALIVSGVRAIRDDEEVPAVTFMDVLQRTPDGRRGTPTP